MEYPQPKKSQSKNWIPRPQGSLIWHRTKRRQKYHPLLRSQRPPNPNRHPLTLSPSKNASKKGSPIQIPYEKILDILKRYGADYADVFAEHTRQTSITCDDHKVEKAHIVNDSGIGIRIILDGHTYFGSTNDFTKKALIGLARDVGKMTLARKRKTARNVLDEISQTSVTSVQQHPAGIASDEKCAMVKRADEVSWKAGREIRQVRVVYRDTVRRITIATSDGNLANDEQVDMVFSVHVVASDDKGLQTGYDPIGGSVGFELFNETPPEEVAGRATARALKMLKARPAPAGRMPVVISSLAGGTMVHEAVGHGLEGDISCKGLSVYSGQIGRKVASELISVADDATLFGKRGSFTFDDEGSPARCTLLIENGILKTYLSNKLMQMRFNQPLSGNARRQNYAFPPIVRMTNTIILPGKDSPEGILRDTASGLFVKKMGGGQVNTINGDFVFDVQEGYLIENGKVGEPVRGALLIGNGPKVLNSIDKVGTDLGFSIGTCGKDGQEVPVSCGQPTIRIPELTVGGR